jgi:hypothetical protein
VWGPLWPRCNLIVPATQQAKSITSLRAKKPADLPLQQPTKYETILNLNAAKARGLAWLLARADEVIDGSGHAWWSGSVPGADIAPV